MGTGARPPERHPARPARAARGGRAPARAPPPCPALGVAQPPGRGGANALPSPDLLVLSPRHPKTTSSRVTQAGAELSGAPWPHPVLVPPQSQHPRPPGSRSGEGFLRFPCGQEFICPGLETQGHPGHPDAPSQRPITHHFSPSLLTFLWARIVSYTLGLCRRSSDTRTARF